MSIKVQNKKPLGQKAYGSIPHLPNSRTGEKDYSIQQGQADILTKKTRDRYDTIIVQEKLDGSNVAIYRNEHGELMALTRAGYLANTSPFPQHHMFQEWVQKNKNRFTFLNKGQRISGEWLAMAHGTRYNLNGRSPFVAFDLWLDKTTRAPYEMFYKRVGFVELATPKLLHMGGAISVDDALKRLGKKGWYGAQEEAEGVVYRCERKGKVDFLAKYVRHSKVDGKYFTPDGEPDVWNWQPEDE